jgi:hypothetical protein
MQESKPGPSLDSLFDQYEDIGGPEMFGPNGTAIILAVWRKSKKLGWSETFQMTNTELQYQSGIKSRDTLNTHRDKLVSSEIIQYTPPPRGQSRGAYTVSFDLLRAGKAVQEMDNFPDNPSEAVQNMDHFLGGSDKAVHKTDNFPDTVLRAFKDTITTTDRDPFDILLDEYCMLHGKLDYHVKATDVTLMQSMVDKKIPVWLITKVMRDLHKERTEAGTIISTFVYYKQAILEAWEAVKAITERVPAPTVALGEDIITDRVPIPEVALGSSPPKRTKQQKELDDLRRRAEEEKRNEQV